MLAFPSLHYLAQMLDVVFGSFGHPDDLRRSPWPLRNLDDLVL